MIGKIRPCDRPWIVPAIWAGAIALQQVGMEYEVQRAARLLAAVRTRRLKAEETDVTLKVHNCAYDYVAATVRCPLAVYSVGGEVPAAAIEAALSELKLGPAAAGAIILWNGRYIEFTSPYDYQYFRRLINSTIKLTILRNADIVIQKFQSHPTKAATILAAAEVGNWIAVVSYAGIPEALFMDLEDHNISSLSRDIEAVGGRLDVSLPRRDSRITVSLTPARPPRAWERRFSAVYSSWYKYIISTTRLLPYQHCRPLPTSIFLTPISPGFPVGAPTRPGA